MANNLPSNLKRHTMFRDKPYSHKVNFPEGYIMPALITAEVRKSNRVIIGITPDVTKEGQSFTFTYSKETLSKIMGLYDQYFLFDGIQILGGEINTVIQIGDPTGGETNVTIAGDTVTVIEIPGSELAQQTLEQVTEKAAEVETARLQTVQKASEAAADRVQTGLDRTAVTSAKDIVVNMQPVRVATFTAMTTLLRLNKPRNFTVIADEFQGVDLVPYEWDGITLFVYGTPVDPQPVVTI